MSIVAATSIEKTGHCVPRLLAPVPSSIGACSLTTLSQLGAQRIGYGFRGSTLPAQIVLPYADVPLGLALIFFMKQLGNCVFLAASQNIFPSFSSRLVDNLPALHAS